VVARSPGRTTLRTFRGDRVDYLDPPTPVNANAAAAQKA
jgi:hypothetical protein